ncbi:MAG: response regulator [Verrucomicrobia bacterium]|nr:response regulator [Verrucomicrobiota bacterium]
MSPGLLQNVSIQRKLTLVIMATTGTALLLISGAFVAYDLKTFRESLVDNLRTWAEAIGGQSAAALEVGYETDVTQFLESWKAPAHVAVAAIYRFQPANLFGKPYRRADHATVVPPPVPNPFPSVDQHQFEGDYLVLWHPIHSSQDLVGAVYLQYDLREIHDRLVRYAGTTALFSLLAAAVAYLLSSRLQRVITRPIFHLAQTARAVSAEKNYAVRAVKHGQDELGQLIDGFNEMLTQIQERDAALQKAHDELERRVQERTRELQLEIVERERAEAALQQQLTRISLLNDITQAISERQDLESILHVVLRQLEEHLAIELGLVGLFEPATGLLTVAAVRARSAPRLAGLELREALTIPLEESGLGMCRHGETVYVPDTRRLDAAWLRRLAAVELFSVTAVPLMVENRLFGILAVARSGRAAFSSREGEFLRMLSEHVALAAHQARLHAKLQSAYNELRQTQQAVMQEERLRALGQMASGIAHDINNALSPAVGFAELLLQSDLNLSVTSKKYLQNIKTAGDDVIHIVARLREFYRRREEREPLFPLNLNEVVEQVIDLTRPRWRDIPQGRGLMVEVGSELDPDMPPLVGIESEIREALTNLIFNAVDAMPGGGAVTIRTRAAGRSPRGHTDYFRKHVVVEVSDTGTGMDEETRKRCLEPFFSTKGQRGTGLGLPMVYGVMERHEGQIEIDSELGKGTTVRLIFPLHERAPDRRPAAPPVRVAGPLRILCIDDEPLVRELLKEILQFDGHLVHVADSGQAGVDAFRAATKQGRPFEVVITDLGMPHLDGHQVAGILKRESPGTPVLMLTGWGAFMTDSGQPSPDVAGILSKPPRMNDVREALARVAGKPAVPFEAGRS